MPCQVGFPGLVLKMRMRSALTEKMATGKWRFFKNLTIYQTFKQLQLNFYPKIKNINKVY